MEFFSCGIVLCYTHNTWYRSKHTPTHNTYEKDNLPLALPFAVYHLNLSESTSQLQFLKNDTRREKRHMLKISSQRIKNIRLTFYSSRSNTKKFRLCNNDLIVIKNRVTVVKQTRDLHVCNQLYTNWIAQSSVED